MSESLQMTLAGLDLVAVSRCLSQLVERDGDLVDAFFERQEVVEVPTAPEAAGIAVRREEGFAIRLSRAREIWIAAGDGLDAERFHSALRQVARSWPQAAYPPPELTVEPWHDAPTSTDVQRFPAALTRALRERLVGFPMKLRVRRHHRWIQVVGPQLVPEPEEERYYSIEAHTPWGAHGQLATSIGDRTVGSIADCLCEAFQARRAEAPAVGPYAVVLAPQAAAIVLHEAVAHALEADTLASGGSIEAAIGLQMGSPQLSVLDDPSSAPRPVRRRTDDEGRSVTRRWLLRNGVVEQPLADGTWSEISGSLAPGAARRGDRNDPPTPRSTHLVVLPGETGDADLLTGGGLWVPEISRGALQMETGVCRLHVPFGYRIEAGELGEAVGGFTVVGRVAELVAAVESVGQEPVETGAGWCAKGSRRVPVWATTPAIRLERVEVTR